MTYQPATNFSPPFYLRNPMLQTFMGSRRLSCGGKQSMIATAEKIILTTDDGVRLQGALSKCEHTHPKGLIILLHGWEGSINSTYIKITGQRLFEDGYHIFRLNLRDHGDTHHLNQGLFYATLFDEVYTAVKQAARLVSKMAVFICGFSLGGNYALRIARHWRQSEDSGPQNGTDLRHVVAISPALDPAKATDAIDEHRYIRKYFLTKWQRSLGLKQRLFPKVYDFSYVISLPTIRAMTEHLIHHYGVYQNADEYFAGYNLCGNALQSIRVPTTIITSADDPIIPVADFYQLTPNSHIHRIIHPHGGHNGFIRNLRGHTWYEDYIRHTFV